VEVQYLDTLKRLHDNQHQDHLKGNVAGSFQATNRLMKELRDIYKSDSYKEGTISV